MRPQQVQPAEYTTGSTFTWTVNEASTTYTHRRLF